MDELLLIETVERYLRNELNDIERAKFDEIRKNNQEIDQLVVENIFFLNQIDSYGNNKKFKQSINDTVSKLITEGFIQQNITSPSSKIVFMWQRYKKTIAVAASIAAIVSIISASLISSFSNSKSNNITPLVEKLKEQDVKYKKLENKIDKINSTNAHRIPEKPRLESKFRATGFMLDVTNNYIITNAHVLNEATHQLIIENNKGQQFSAETVYSNINNDIAILKITDPDFVKLSPTPYSIRKSNANLGDAVFMLGYPKQEIVYGEGYISAKNGYEMDSNFCQLSTLANQGNSGSPVINKNGELVAIVSSKEANSVGVVFAIKSSNIYTVINEINKGELKNKIKLTTNPILRKTDRVSQIKKVQDYVFMIKGN